MSCFVALADSTVFEIDFTVQSDGLEILTKASSVRSDVLTTAYILIYLYTAYSATFQAIRGGRVGLNFYRSSKVKTSRGLCTE